MPLTPHSVHDLAEAVLGCVCVALDTAAADGVEGALGCPCRACVIPGAVAWDGCDAIEGCGGDGGAPGQLTVSVARIYPAGQNFPAEDRTVQGVRGCTPPPLTAAELIITLLRCAPVVDEGGCPPSCEELTEAARAVHVDAATVYSALWCCLPGLGPNPRRPRRFTVGGQRIIGPEGGCVGLEQRVTVALPGCGTCPGEDAS
ncbi:hypothetical protein PH213_20285 [Streptomyces sp. SRF1]|uniref:hypothetical protein n=1 Tax=Streptomyces sp. SRF1 TaxID=1549642 RepID=UPI0025AF4444|nr:hypothetical protein [Streptomyces sp. SRF1]MDN3056845.1 hypothetical protein [Streptomyces sp. SRF1]